MFSPSWTVVLPVKRTSVAKTRLLDEDSSLRRSLALAFATDTAAAVAACPPVAHIVVVTDDDEAAEMARRLGALHLPDSPDAGLNAALRHGFKTARLLRPHDAVALLSADLPALRPAELARALSACSRHDQAFVCDALGTGTTLLTALAPRDVSPHFGARSRARHRYAGYAEVGDEGLATLRRDVDTWADLADARRLGVGAATSGVLEGR